jgi:hypothetical protein
MPKGYKALSMTCKLFADLPAGNMEYSFNELHGNQRDFLDSHSIANIALHCIQNIS